MSYIEALLCAILRGEQPDWPRNESKDLETRFIDSAVFHGVMPLLHEKLEPCWAIEKGCRKVFLMPATSRPWFTPCGSYVIDTC